MLHERKHRKVSMTKVSKQKLEAEFCQHPSASRVANQVPCEPKYPLSKFMWRPKQKSLAEASGVATPKPRLSREGKGKMPVCSNNAASREVTTVIISSPNSRAATPGGYLVLTSEATVRQRTSRVHGREAKAKVLSKAKPLRSSIADKAPQHAPLSSSSSTKVAPGGEARTEVLFSANSFRGDKKNRTLSYVRSKRASALDCLGPSGSDLQELLTNKRTSSSCYQQVGM